MTCFVLLFAVDLFLMFITVRDMGGYHQVIDYLLLFLLQQLQKRCVTFKSNATNIRSE